METADMDHSRMVSTEDVNREMRQQLMEELDSRYVKWGEILALLVCRSKRSSREDNIEAKEMQDGWVEIGP